MLIKEIQLQTNHLSAIHHFYKDVLELNTVYRGKNGIVISAGKSELIFEETDAGTNPFYHFAFNIPSNKFEEAFEFVKQKAELLWLEDYKSYIRISLTGMQNHFIFLILEEIF